MTQDFNPQTIAPELDFYVIGDVHGSMDLLNTLLDRLDPAIPRVLVGDYIDRGEHSADVLRFLFDRPDHVCLLGNHEEMMIQFLDDPERNGKRWMNHGGLQTLASFGIGGVTPSAGAETMRRVRNELRDRMGADLETWLRGLPHYILTGNVAVVHAACDPRLQIAEQGLTPLIWGHRNFRQVPRLDGIWVVHGHTIVDAPEVRQGVISVDTGAYATGRLSAALIRQGGVEFVHGTRHV